MRDQNMKQDSQKRNNYEKKTKTKMKIRSPLLDLDSNSTEVDVSAHSSSINGGHNSCFHFLVSSNYSSSSSLSGNGPRKKPKSTKQNILPIPISLEPQIKNSKKTQIFPDLCSHMKNARSGSGKVRANLKRMEHRNGPVQVFDLDNVSSSENFTPVGKRKFADCGKFEGNNNNVILEDSDKKTPPIKSSVSPEIECSVFSATSTPCYSAGHILSGISDKRKCRPIGVLTVGNLPDASLDSEKVNEKSCIIGMLNEEKSDCLVPLPAEASMHWLSPSLCFKVDYDDKSDEHEFESELAEVVNDGVT